MVRVAFTSMFATILFAAQPAQAGEEVLFGPVPDWVAAVDADTGAVLDTDLPVHLLLNDVQTLFEPERQTIYNAITLEIRNPQGLSAGNLSIPWRADTDDLTVHYVRIRRGDEVIDVLDEGQTFTVLRREQSLEMATLTGILTANMFPAGLEVGDTLELAYTIVEDHPVLDGHAEAVFGPFNVPVGTVHARVNWTGDLDVKLKTTRGMPELRQGRERGLSYAEFTLAGADPLVLPEGAPGRYALVRMLEASSFASWAEVAELFAPIYREAARIPASGRLRDEVEEIRAATEDPVRRAEMALALVQDKVRYVALAMGAGGLLPADTQTTWSRRYGDCKAKTTLLIGLLQELGIAAEPVFVNTVLGDALPGMLPRVGDFDHVIVRAHIGGREYWMDGTGIGDTSLERLQVPYYAWGLPVVAGAELVPMVPAALERPNEDMLVRIDASAGVRGAAPFRAEVVYRGDDAIITNTVITQLVGDSRRQALEQFWRERFDYVEIEGTETQYDAAAGEFRITLEGTAEMDWGSSSFEPTGMRVGYDPDFTRQPGPDADAPFVTGHPFYSRRTYEVTLPDGFAQEQVDGEDVAATIAGVEYNRSLKLEGNLFTATRSTRSIVPEISLDEALAAKDQLERLYDKRVFLRLPSSYRVTEADIATMSRADGTNVRDLIDQGNDLLEIGEYEAGAAVLDRAVELAPQDVWAWANQAISLVYLGKLEAARASTERAMALDPDNFVAHHASAMLALRLGDDEGAIEELGKAIAQEDENVWALRQRATIYTRLDRHEEALADAEELSRINPDDVSAYAMQIDQLAMLDRKPEALALLRTLPERLPDALNFDAMISELYFRLGMEEESDAILDRSLEDNPDPMTLVARAQRRPIREYDEKLADLDLALELDPDFLPALQMRADQLFADYQYDRALADVNRIIELQPEFPGAYMTKVRILLELGRKTDAGRTVDALVAQNGADPRVLAMAAQSYESAGLHAKASAAIERALELAPGDEVVQSIYEGVTRR